MPAHAVPSSVTVEPPVVIAARQLQYREELRGVNGWLLVFCSVLLVGIPLSHGAIAIRSFTHPASGFQHAHDLVKAILYLAIAVYSVIAGLRLWQLKPDAPQFAKDFLLVSTTAVVVMYVAFYATGSSADIGLLLFRRMLYAGLWYLYLSYSDRVRITYGVV